MDQTFLSGLTGIIVTPDSGEYESARQIWNRAIQKYPLVINYCLTIRDVQNAVVWARRRCMDIRIRSGGHNYEGYCVGNGLLVIDVSRMKGIEFDGQRKIVRAQSGVTNAQMYDYTGEKGFLFPGGTCGTVGVSGLSLGGGWGYSCRLLGLACDSLVELELVDADGDLLVANERRNRDLFWACRGAGGNNFGVVVSMSFRLEKESQLVTLFEIDGPNASIEAKVDFLDTWQRWLPTVGENLGAQGGVYNSAADGQYYYARGLFFGPPQEAADVLSPFFSLANCTVSLRYLPFPEAMAAIGASYPPFESFKSTGRFARAQYTREELLALVESTQDRAVGSVLASVGVYALGGKVGGVGPQETAFFYREAPYIFNIQSVWEDPAVAEANRAWLNERFAYLKSITDGSYVNFPINILPRYEFEYFGLNAPRLSAVVAKYDPCGVFRFPQGLRPIL